MPSRNTIREDTANAYYHVYARGVNKMVLFPSPADYEHFIAICRRYLSVEELYDSAGTPYEKLYEVVQIAGYCLMPNHFHLLVYQVEPKSMERLKRGIMTGYSMYFNRKYARRGPLFESRYRASRITTDAYLQHISRYIHLNPREWRTWPYSSLPEYLDGQASDWVQIDRIKNLFTSTKDYYNFVSDYETAKRELDSLKHELADY